MTIELGKFSRLSNIHTDDHVIDIDWIVFCNALLAIDFNNNVWVLPTNPVNEHDTTIYILPIYRTLLNHTELSPLNNKRSLVLGQPGIGKSTLSVPIMKQRMMQGRPFFFTQPGSTEAYVWRPIEGPTVIPFADLVHDRNMLWIMNQEEHGGFLSSSCNTVLLASPTGSNYNAYAKQFHCVLNIVNMPLPSEEEVIAIAALKNFTDENEVRRRISIVGRIPRSVCAKDFNRVVGKIHKALATCSFNADIFGSRMDFRSSIFAVNADENFKESTRDEFVSDIVCKWYMEAWQKHDELGFRKFIAAGEYLWKYASSSSSSSSPRTE